MVAEVERDWLGRMCTPMRWRACGYTRRWPLPWLLLGTLYGAGASTTYFDAVFYRINPSCSSSTAAVCVSR